MFALQHPTSELDGAGTGVEAVDAMAEIEQRDDVASGATADDEHVILGLQEAPIDRALPRHEARKDAGLAPAEIVPPPGDSLAHIVNS